MRICGGARCLLNNLSAHWHRERQPTAAQSQQVGGWAGVFLDQGVAFVLGPQLLPADHTCACVPGAVTEKERSPPQNKKARLLANRADDLVVDVRDLAVGETVILLTLSLHHY